MGHHSYFEVAGHTFLYCRESYLPDVAALFTEEDRCPVVEHTHDNGEPWSEFVYASTVTALRERLQVQGFTAQHAREALTAVVTGMNDEHAGWALDAAKVADDVRQRLATDADVAPIGDSVYELLTEISYRMDCRSFVRLLLDCAPDPLGAAYLNLTQLTGCCVELDATQPIAGHARAQQLDGLTQYAPLLVLTEGPTDARLLAAGMDVTHPHLRGYVSFFDYALGGAEGGVAQLARNVAAFVGAGVANRFVAIADADTEGRAGMEKTQQRARPDRCRLLHYPPLPLLESYPTLGPHTDGPVLADVNGLAGSLELYLGRDVLQGENGLMPVQWRSWNPRLQQFHGSLTDHDKKTAQDRFLDKVKAHHAGTRPADADWSGIRAVIDSVVNAFDGGNSD